MHKNFIAAVWEYYRQHGRHALPWRLPEPDGSFDPYKILVSEVMLQQTQVPRVVPKYTEFLWRFPDIRTLGSAPLGDVLIAWQSLGYNRRAKYLWQAAQATIRQFGGVLPNDQAALESLPGIGANTAGAIRAYAYNEPAVFIETNIRTAYINHFFSDQVHVPDHAIREVLVETLDTRHPREWYWALMDFGSHLKGTVGNASRASKSYTRQSPFDGSLRQIRGRVLALLSGGPKDVDDLLGGLADERSERVLRDLAAEGLIQKTAGKYRLP